MRLGLLFIYNILKILSLSSQRFTSAHSRDSLEENSLEDCQAQLLQVARIGNLSHVQVLIENCSLNSINSDGDSALLLAVTYGHYWTVKALLEKGAVINTANKFGFTPLHIACAHNFTQIAIELITSQQSQDVKINARTEHEGRTALMYASMAGNFPLVSALIDAGAKIHLTDYVRGETCLFYAIHSKNTDLVEYLVNKGSDVNIQETAKIKTPLMLALSHGASDIALVLLNAGSNIILRDIVGNDAFYYALETGNMHLANKIQQLKRTFH